MKITSIQKSKKSASKMMITVAQSGRSTTLHLVNGVDVYGRSWDALYGEFTGTFRIVKRLDPKNLDAVDPRPLLTPAPEVAE